MKPSSAKAKGRRLQQFVADRVLTWLNRHTSGPELTDDDVRPAIMGESGEDIKLSSAARRMWPFSVECKNTERLNVWKSLSQAEGNCGDYTPLLVFKRNRSAAYVALRFDHFMGLLSADE